MGVTGAIQVPIFADDAPGYEADFHDWSREQAARLRLLRIPRPRQQEPGGGDRGFSAQRQAGAGKPIESFADAPAEMAILAFAKGKELAIYDPRAA